MPKVIMMVNVELDPTNRSSYLEATGRLKERFNNGSDVQYAVYEKQGKEQNAFTEVFTFNDEAAYDAFDDGEDEEIKDLFGRITGLSRSTPRYTTLVEVG